MTVSDVVGLNFAHEEERQQPLSLATVKGYTGHQEAGAGVAGLMEALNLVSFSSIPPALHLTNLNPHVAATLQGRAVGIARGGPAPVGQTSASGLLVTGVSSFGAEGTNAHALSGVQALWYLSGRGTQLSCRQADIGLHQLLRYIHFAMSWHRKGSNAVI